MSTKEQRERFEAWFSDNGLYPKAIERDKRGYLLSTASTAWEAWQAAEAAAIERCAEVADMVRSKFSSNGHIQQAAGAWCVHEELRALLPKEGS